MSSISTKSRLGTFLVRATRHIADTVYPEKAADRSDWILSRRPERNAVDPRRPYAFLMENERAEPGELVPTATVFLTNRECPWRCLMCDLWKNTVSNPVPMGAIPEQIDFALKELTRQAAESGHAAPEQIKLYNSGSFFDPKAIPEADYPVIARRVREFKRVIVECHPALIGERVLRFRDMVEGRLEVAMGLETVHPEVLEKLNKRVTVEQFASAAAFLLQHEIAMRAFVLVKPPFMDESTALEWARRSIVFAFDCGATAVVLIPVRSGNGALDALQRMGEFEPPKLRTLEEAVWYGLGLQRGRVFADLWDLQLFSSCPKCFPQRLARLQIFNETQTMSLCPPCEVCGE